MNVKRLGQQVAGLLLVVMFLLQNGATSVHAADDTGVTVGEVKNVLYNVSRAEVPENNGACERILKGTVEYTWPSNSFKDVVVIQDFSGSFEGTIEKLGGYIDRLTNNFDFGTDVDGTSPKDRMMFVGYQGSEGYARVNYGSQTFYEQLGGSYRVDNTALMTDVADVKRYIADNYRAARTDGGTPTIDGMRLAQSAYTAAIQDNANYNSNHYAVLDSATGTVGTRKRETIYILLTDGAANNAKWNNIPEAARRELSVNGQMPPAYGLAGDPNRSYNWSDIDNTEGRVAGDGRIESYKPLLNGMAIISQELQTNGGIKEAGTQKRLPAVFVSTFFEDKRALSSNESGFYGSDWAKMENNVHAGMEKLATVFTDRSGQKTPLYATSENIESYAQNILTLVTQRQLEEELKSNTFNEVRINLGDGVNVNKFRLFKQGDDPGTADKV